jgi:hypothetical protein
MPFTQLIYCSRPSLPDARHHEMLASIMDIAVRHNSRNAITGCLGHSKDWFLQVIEGPEVAVAETYSRIELDQRHSDVRILLTREIKNRSFPEWSMMSVPLDDSATAFRAGGAFSPLTIPALQLLMRLMNAADAKRMKR